MVEALGGGGGVAVFYEWRTDKNLGVEWGVA